MAWTAISVPITGQLITAGFWQAQISDNLTILKTSIDDNGHLNYSNSYQTTNYTATLIDDVILADATAGPITITLPAGVVTRKRYEVKKIDGTANAVTVASSELIDGISTFALVVPNQSVSLQRSTQFASWYIV